MPVIRDDVIAAIASPVGACARIVLRISGGGSHLLLKRIIVSPQELPDHGVVNVTLRVDGLQFVALLLLFEKGRSYTGEESAELHIPGNPLLARMTLEELYVAGAKPAEPGEFTARAFFNGRLDLTGAEAVAATIAASNQRELDAARRLGAGELADRVRPIMDHLTETLALVEAGIDFSEEDISFISQDEVRRNARDTVASLRQLLADTARFERLAHEPLVVLCGRPNAGKSTLLNTLAGRQRAIVSPVAGTTRDLLTAEVTLMRGTVRLLDTAGLEEIDGDDPIAHQMHQRALRAIEQADVLLLLQEAGDRQPPPPLSRQPDLVVRTKCDMAPAADADLAISALTGEGVDRLREQLDELAFGAAGDETLALNTRHIRQIEQAMAELEELASAGEMNEELVAEHLRLAVDALGEITGMVSTDDLLGRIFSSFCIGK